MLIFFDFDDVLFNTKKFREDYFDLFKKIGVNKKIFEDCYYDSLDKKGIKIYSPMGHVNRICRKYRINISKIKKEITNFIEDTSSYVFEDSTLVLKNIPKNNLYLISFSKTNFQKSKILNSGIVDYFRDIRIIDELKGLEINKILKNRKCELVYFIDDRVEQINDVKLKNPTVKTILLRRKEGRYFDKRSKLCDFVANNGKDILKILNLNQYNGKNKDKK